VIRLILQTFFKQGVRPFLIILQLMVGFISLSIGFSMVEGTYRYTEDIKKLASIDEIRLGIIDDGTTSVSYEEMKHLYQYIQQNKLVSNAGTFLVQQLQFSELNKVIKMGPNRVRTNVAFVDSSFIKMFHFKVTKGRSLSISDESDLVNSKIPVLVGSQLAKEFPVGSTLHSGIADDLKMTVVPKEFLVVGILPSNMTFWKGNSTSLDGTLLHDDNMIIAPMQKEQDYGEQFKTRISMNMLVKLKDPLKFSDFQIQAEKKINQFGLISHVSSIRFELDNLNKANKIPILLTLGFAGLLLILSSFGLLGVVLASIVRRHREFGIRYAVGATPFSLALLVGGEILLLILISSTFGLVLTKLISTALPANLLLHPGVITIVSTLLAVISLSLVSALIPMLRMLKLQPIELIGGNSYD
jgi:putative ABC transport system permease protein